MVFLIDSCKIVSLVQIFWENWFLWSDSESILPGESKISSCQITVLSDTKSQAKYYTSQPTITLQRPEPDQRSWFIWSYFNHKQLRVNRHYSLKLKYWTIWVVVARLVVILHSKHSQDLTFCFPFHSDSPTHVFVCESSLSFFLFIQSTKSSAGSVY